MYQRLSHPIFFWTSKNHLRCEKDEITVNPTPSSHLFARMLPPRVPGMQASAQCRLAPPLLVHWRTLPPRVIGTSNWRALRHPIRGSQTRIVAGMQARKVWGWELQSWDCIFAMNCREQFTAELVRYPLN